jgi:hypothetical protein
MAWLDRAIALSIVLVPMAWSSQTITRNGGTSVGGTSVSGTSVGV